MALIGTIRKNSWLLIIFIGLGLALFIVTSMFVGNQSPFSGSQTTIGDINGNKVDWTEFTFAEDALYSGSGDVFGRRSSLWNYFVENALVKDEAEELGLSVGEDELYELQFGNNLSPIITSRFMNPQTRQVDRAQLSQIQSILGTDQISPSYERYWNYQEKEIVKDRLQSKLNALVSKALYTPTWMVEQVHADQSQSTTFRYVQIPYSEVDNADVTLSEGDYAAYFAENKAKYYQDEESRKLEYVVFEVLPTKIDSANIRRELTELMPKFEAATNDTIFTENNYGAIDQRYYAKEDTKPGNPATGQPADPMNEAMADALFNAEIGKTVGPFIKDGSYVIAKLMDRRVLPDSAKTRHILIGPDPQQAPQPLTETKYRSYEKTVDSLKNLIESGVTVFDSLVAKHSVDRASIPKMGVYDWAPVNSYVAPFEKVVFQSGEIGKLYSVRTQFGVHLIEPLGRKFADPDNKTERVKIAAISKPIVPSEDTQKSIYNDAHDFMANNRDLASFNARATELNKTVETSQPLKHNDFSIGTLGGGNSTRDMIRWGFNGGTDVGDVAPDVYSFQDPIEYFDSKYVVVALKSVQSAGTPKLAFVKEEIEPAVYNLKKGEVIKGKINGTDLGAIASNFETQVDTATNVTFKSAFITGIGSEPKVVAAAFNLEPGSVSQPIMGTKGVFVLQLVTKTPATAAANIPTLRRQTSSTTQSQVRSQLIQAMKKNAEVKDYRSKFY